MIRDLISEAERFLGEQNIPAPRLEADVLLAHALQTDRIELYKNPDRKIGGAESEVFHMLLEQRTSGVPTAYLRGKKEFFSRMFQVGPGVLIPRAETEFIVEEGLRQLGASPPHILDIGTGSGAILITLLLERCDATGLGTDKSPAALDFAVKNSELLGVKNRIRCAKGNFFEPVEKDEKFDLIVSNPPYIPSDKIPEELRFEPKEAFDGGPDGLRDYREIIAGAFKFLKPNGHLVLEIGIDNRPGLDQILSAYPQYEKPIYKKDLAGIDRVIILKKR